MLNYLEPLEADDIIEKLSILLFLLISLCASATDFLLIEKEDSSPFVKLDPILVIGFLNVFLILASILPIIDLGFLGP